MEALELDPEFALASLRLGNWHAARGEDEEAIRYFRRTSEIRPDSPVPYNNVGLALMRMGDKGAALEAFEAGLALSLDPQVCACVCVCVCVCVCLGVCLGVYVRACGCGWVVGWVCKHIMCIYTYMYIYIYVCICIFI